MNLAIKLTLAAAGIFLFAGLLLGVLKYRGIMRSPEHCAPVYIDIAHRAALMYSFAALVMAELLKFSPYSESVQLLITGAPLLFFAIAIAQYTKLGLENKTDNQFRQRNFNTTWGIWLLIVAEVGGVGAIVWGFISTQFLA
ncbi:hypothetical protein [Pseudomonas sp. N040]|uniref:hypothetical protein n=1 Tax=Pseudomonas sp. N040 TaxID=2785325 RepID=UPI0018A326BD|nr:hypothetical protein [Pseudomonas sp. N040]MBF7728954.1 hypothetical protein [Pseudomonas sp. N040]MBW7012594.1 hypothetical protein [Pseudomonas sp. N040]